MFYSDYRIEDLIEQIKAEVDSYNEVPQNELLMAYNTCILQLYKGVIKEQKVISYPAYGQKIQLLHGKKETDRIEFENVEAVKIGLTTYTKATAKGSSGFEHCYYKGLKEENMDTIVLDEAPTGGETMTIYYNDVPKIVKSLNDVTSNSNVESDSDVESVVVTNDKEFIPLPNEYVPMVYSFVRGEAYKWINEDSLSAKWISDYNAQLEAFTAWIATNKPQFGA
jgi:hypothetical protein